MAKEIYTNKTKYSREYQKKVAILNVFSKDKLMLPAILMGVNLFTGSVSLRNDPTSLNGWVMMLMGFVIFPLIFIVAPYFITMKGYKTMTKNSIDNSFYVEAEFTNTILRLKNSLGQTYNVLYENLISVEINKDTMIIKEKKSDKPTYLDINSFKGGTYQEVKEFLEAKIKENNIK